MTSKHTLSVVIPSWNSLRQLKKNLPSVFLSAQQVGAEIIVVDDCSESDQTITYLESLGSKITLLKNSHNLGFSATVNRGVSVAKGSHIALLNTDVRPDLNCFKKALKYFSDDSIFAVAFNSGEGRMRGEWSRGLFHHFRVNSANSSPVRSELSLWASGGQAMFAKDKWEQLGGMDTLYKPFYWEDTDLGYRAWKRNWQILWAPECKVVHDHDSSVIANNYSKQYINSYAQRNQFLFIWKNISDSSMLFSHFLYLPIYTWRYPRTVFSALKLLPKALKSRARERAFWKISDQAILSPWKK